MGIYGKIWEHMGKYGKMWENMGKSRISKIVLGMKSSLMRFSYQKWSSTVINDMLQFFAGDAGYELEIMIDRHQ